MVKSMTGYGRGTASEEGKGFNIEMRSVNNRYLDINIRLPRTLNSLEDKIRKEISSMVSRGKIDVYINQEGLNENDATVNVNEHMAVEYFNAYSRVRDLLNIEEDISLSLITKSPDVIVLEKKEEDIDKIYSILLEALKEALNIFIDMRKVEGKKLSEDILARCENILVILEEVEEKSSIVVNEYREKITQRVKEFLDEIELDEAKLLNEVAFFSDRCSITEEIVRLKSHIAQMKDTLESSENSVGRKLDFLIQEMNREANTIGSKANNLFITKMVVNIKSELEKIREQVQNIE